MVCVRDYTNEVSDASFGGRDERQDEGTDPGVRRVTVHDFTPSVGGG